MSKSKTIAVYPGTFDPLTNGHLDIIKRASAMFDELYVAVSDHSRKSTMFSAKERCEMVNNVAKVEGIGNVKAVVYNNMLVDCAKDLSAKYIIRGLRVTSDFDYEYQMTQFINDLGKEGAEVVYLMAARNTLHISSSMVKEIAALGSDVSAYLPKNVNLLMKGKFNG